jgi:hypothetical protein
MSSCSKTRKTNTQQVPKDSRFYPQHGICPGWQHSELLLQCFFDLPFSLKTSVIWNVFRDRCKRNHSSGKELKLVGWNRFSFSGILLLTKASFLDSSLSPGSSCVHINLTHLGHCLLFTGKRQPFGWWLVRSCLCWPAPFANLNQIFAGTSARAHLALKRWQVTCVSSCDP